MSSNASASNFQKNLNIIYKWSIDWQLTISISKCNLFELGYHCLSPPLFISTHQIAYTQAIKDLGVTFEPNLKFVQHIIHDITAKANQRANLIHRCFISRSIDNLIRAFIVYVRPLLEYVSPVWAPSHVYSINSIEQVQQSFTRRLPGFKNLSYVERLTRLHIPSLEHRRLMTDLTTCFNIVHGFTSLKFENFFKFSPVRFNTRGHHLRLIIPLTENNTHKFYFSSRVVLPWNALPEDVVSASSTISFKKKLSKIDLTKFLPFPCIL